MHKINLHAQNKKEKPLCVKYNTKEFSLSVNYKYYVLCIFEVNIKCLLAEDSKG